MHEFDQDDPAKREQANGMFAGTSMAAGVAATDRGKARQDAVGGTEDVGYLQAKRALAG